MNIITTIHYKSVNLINLHQQDLQFDKINSNYLKKSVSLKHTSFQSISRFIAYKGVLQNE